MARTATQTTAPAELMGADQQAEQQLATLQDSAIVQHDAELHALALQLHYQGSIHPDVLENNARDAMRRIGMAVFELGGYLLLLKKASGHGEFMGALERLGVAPRAAQSYMAITKRFANAQTSAHLERLGYSKMAELLPLEDASLEDLLEQEGGIDAIDRMSVRELRAAVREAKAEAAAKDQLLEDKNKRIDKLHAQQQRIQTAPPDEVLADLKREATAMATEVEGVLIGRLRHALIALDNHGDERGQQDVFMAGLLGQVQRQLNTLREQFGLADAAQDTAPAWQQWADQQDAQAGAAPAAEASAH